MDEFDFKKGQKELIRRELRPILYEQGFVLSRPTTYIRERDGLLQEFFFKVEMCGLRPWISYRPVYDSRHIVNFGTDHIWTHDVQNPYRGFSSCGLDYWYHENTALKYKYFQNKFLPAFENLKRSIANGVLPEMDQLHSLDDFIHLRQTDGMLFQNNCRSYDGFDIYFNFIMKVRTTSGKERMDYILREMERYDLRNLPKIVREYLESYKACTCTDDEADQIFEEYCNNIRLANKLIKKK